MDYNQELGVKGYCFRGYKDNATVAQKTRAIGVDRIDLSRAQLDFQDPAAHDPAIAAYTDAGVAIVGIGVVGCVGDQAERHYFEFCRKAGCRTVSVNFQPDSYLQALRQVERLAEEHDCRVAIHNHGGKHWLGNAQMLRHVLGQAGPRVGLCIDTAWCIHAGEDPIRWVEEFGPRVFAVHYKDFLFDPKGRHRDVVVGTGALDLPAFVAALQGVGFEGPSVIEYEADVDNPVPALTECVRAMRGVLRDLSADVVA